MAKRRAASTPVPTAPIASTSSNDNNNNAAMAPSNSSNAQRRIYSPADIPELMELLHRQDNAESCLEAVRGFRRMLSIEKNPPVEAVLSCGVMPALIQILANGNNELLQFEACWALTNIASTDYTKCVVEAGAVPHLVALLSSPHADCREQSAWCLGNIAGDCAELRDVVLNCNALAPMLQNIQQPANDSLLSNVVWSLSNMCRGKPQPHLNMIQPCLPVLAALLQTSKNNEILVDVCWSLSYLSDGDEQRIQAVMENNVAPIMVQLLDAGAPSLINPIIRTLGNFVSGSDAQTQAVVDCGIIAKTPALLSTPGQRKVVKKETCWLLSNIAAGTHQQINAIFKERTVMSTVVNLIQRGEWEVRKEATWVLSNIATGGCDEHVMGIVEYGAIKALCSILEVADSKIVLVALDALAAILKVGTKNGSNYAVLVDEAGGIEMIENLQEHENEKIYLKAVDILEEYFHGEGQEDENLAPSDNGNAFTFGVSKNVNIGMFGGEQQSQQPFYQQQSPAAPLQFNFANNSTY